MQTRKSHQKKMKLKKKGGTKKSMTIQKTNPSNNTFNEDMLYFTIEYDSTTEKFKIRKVTMKEAEDMKDRLPIYLVETK